MIEKLGLAALRQLDPERAHGLAVAALRHGLVPMPGPVGSDRLRIRLAGLDLPNPVGLAAGFDKNATAVDALTRAGFGFVEVGAATPRPQPGNPQPRLFRLTEDRAAINRFGFNNDGVEAIAKRLADSPRAVPVGLNLGANKDSLDRAADFAAVLTRAGAHVDFATVNVSSPNTEKLRDLQGAAALKALLQGVLDARDALPRRVPVFLKIAPDLDDAEIEEIAAVALAAPVDAIIATNTTLSRDGLRSAHRDEAGGLSGAPLFDRSTRVLARLYLATDGRVPLVGVGGIASAADALRKIRAGATAVQFYTAMVFQGISLASRLPREMDEILVRNNVASVSELVGLDAEDWAKEG